MRISDWSSDVCSSDLLFDPRCQFHAVCRGIDDAFFELFAQAFQPFAGLENPSLGEIPDKLRQFVHRHARVACRFPSPHQRDIFFLEDIEEIFPFERVRIDERSEEHTSELQSLMRISYAVFCLKKKK